MKQFEGLWSCRFTAIILFTFCVFGTIRSLETSRKFSQRESVNSTRLSNSSQVDSTIAVCPGLSNGITYVAPDTFAYEWLLDISSPMNTILLGPGLVPSLDAVQSVLSGKHVVFVGDSLTRYQYINLVHWLRTGRWFADAPPFSEWEKDWPSWPAFYEGTNNRLRGWEICDCFRDESNTWSSGSEHRYFNDPERAIRITYLQMFGLHNSPFNNLAWLNVDCMNEKFSAALSVGSDCSLRRNNISNVCAQTGCLPGKCNAPAIASILPPFHTVSELISSILPVDMLIINSGFWSIDKLDRDVTENNLMPTLRRLKNLTGASVVWKTTTAISEGFQPRDNEAREAFQSEGWPIYDSYGITASLTRMASESSANKQAIYADRSHYRPWVYKGLNEALLSGMLRG